VRGCAVGAKTSTGRGSIKPPQLGGELRDAQDAGRATRRVRSPVAAAAAPRVVTSPSSMPSSIPCPDCGQPMADGAARCASCRTAAAGATAGCAVCAAPLRPGERQCAACGHRVVLSHAALSAQARREAATRLRADAERNLAGGNLAAAGRLLDELRALAADATDEAVCANLGRRLATAVDAARAARAEAVAAQLRAGDVRAAEVGLRAARAVGLDDEAADALAARIRASHRAAWRRRLLRAAAGVALLGAGALAWVARGDRAAIADGVRAFAAGRFAEAEDGFRRVVLRHDAVVAGRAALATIAGRARSWDDADADLLHTTAQALRQVAELATVADAAGARVPARLQHEVTARGFVLAADGLRQRDGATVAPDAAASWSFRLADGPPMAPAARSAPTPNAIAADVGIACRHRDGAEYVVPAAPRRKDRPPALRWQQAASPLAAGAPTEPPQALPDLDIGTAAALAFVVDDAQALGGDAAPTMTIVTDPPEVLRCTAPTPLPGGAWQVRVLGVTAGEATIEVRARDFCGHASPPLRGTLRVRAAPAAAAQGATTTPDPPRLRVALPVATNATSLRVEAVAAGADAIAVCDRADGRQIAALERLGEAFVGMLPLPEGTLRWRLRASNAAGVREADLDDVVCDRTPPQVTQYPPAVVEVGAPLVVTFDEALGDPGRAPRGDTLGVDGPRLLLRPVEAVGPFARVFAAIDRLGNAVTPHVVSGVAVRRTRFGEPSATAGRRWLLAGAPGALVGDQQTMRWLDEDGRAHSLPLGDLGAPVAADATVVGRCLVLHASGYVTAWGRAADGAWSALAPPRRGLRRGEQGNAILWQPDLGALLWTDRGAARFDLVRGERDDDGWRAPPQRASHVAGDGVGFVALLADGGIAQCLGERPMTWLVDDDAPADAVALAVPTRQPDDGVLVATRAGAVWRGVRAVYAERGFDWSELAAGVGAAATALSCAALADGFALATADGTLRVTGCQHMSPIVIPDAQRRAIDGLAGPLPGRGGGPRRTLVGSADGRLTVVEHP
jgi:hypothetical protein